jgi:ABC-type glycerol-3-phosphate transport system permease component
MGRHEGIRRLSLGITMAVVVLFVALPFYWLAISSLKAGPQLFTVDAIPSTVTFENYLDLLGGSLFPRYFLNSIIVATVVTTSTVVIAVLGAYSLVFFRYRGRETLGRLLLFTYMFPGVIIILPTYGIMSRLRLTDSLVGVIVIELVLTVPFSVWMLRGFLAQVPKEIEEAAIIDGCSRMQALRRVIVPVSLSGIVAVAVFAFIFSWNEYLFPLVLINSEDQKTLPLGIAGLMGHLYPEWGALLASGVLSTIPILILFIFLQRYLIQGIMAGSVKG